MYLGTQVQARNDDDFKQWAQLGVLNICSDPPGNPHLWSEDDLLSHKEKVNSFAEKHNCPPYLDLESFLDSYIEAV